MSRIFGAVFGATMMCAPVAAQLPVQQAMPIAPSATAIASASMAATGRPAAQRILELPSGTVVWLRLERRLSSQTIRPGEMFDMMVSHDVLLGSHVVIPAGTLAHGRISYRTGRGAFGKSAKMEFDVADVVLPDRTIPLTGHFRVEGEGNTAATVGAIFAVGVLGGVIVSGHSAVAVQGSEWRGATTAPLTVAIADPAPSQPARAPTVAELLAAMPAAPAYVPAGTPSDLARLMRNVSYWN